MEKSFDAYLAQAAREMSGKFNISIDTATTILKKMAGEMFKPDGRMRSEEEFVKHFQGLLAKDASNGAKWATDVTDDIVGRASVVYLKAKSSGHDPVTAISMKFGIPMDGAKDIVDKLKESFKD